MYLAANIILIQNNNFITFLLYNLNMKQTFLTLSLIVMILFSGFTQSVLPMKKVSLFKNSTCLVSKEGQLKSKNGVFVLPVPSTA